MRLRQIALVAHDLDTVVGQLDNVLGLKVAYNDPGVERYGLKNAVLPAGTGFLEVVAPFRDDVSAARYLTRRGGDTGYMVILQTPDAGADSARIAQLGVRIVDEIDRPIYRAAHFHPVDFGGILTSVDTQRDVTDYLDPYGEWMPAGPSWRGACTEDVTDLLAVTISAEDPDALAARWAELLGVTPDPADSRRLPLAHGAIEFDAAEAGAGTSLSGITLQVADVEAISLRAAEAEVVVDDGIVIGGVHFRLAEQPAG